MVLLPEITAPSPVSSQPRHLLGSGISNYGFFELNLARAGSTVIETFHRTTLANKLDKKLCEEYDRNCRSQRWATVRKEKRMDTPVEVVSPIAKLRAFFPDGGTLPEEVRQKRYSFLLGLTWLHALVIALIGPALGRIKRLGRSFQATAIAVGLMTASAILVHLSGGYIEVHFHFFVMLTFLALLQDWIPYLLAIAYVGIHHGLVGAFWPEEVFNHPAAINAPWTWAG